MKKILGVSCASLGSGLLVSALSVSCGKPDVQSVEWYKQHETERNAMLAKCRANPDLVRTDENCRNAGDAQALSGSYTPSPVKKW
ncbi:MAG: EexN family lipoprotein [Burkholderiaceae bacterium]